MSTRTMQSEQKESSNRWTKIHPCLKPFFYNDLDAPSNEEEALTKMQCHQHAVTDIKYQIEVCETEIKIELARKGEYNHEKLDRLHEQKIRLINALRFNENATNAYWYYLQ